MTASWFRVALRHDRAVVRGSLAFVVLLTWSYLLLGAGVGPEMMDMGAGKMMAMPPEWSLGYGLVIFVMWAVTIRPRKGSQPTLRWRGVDSNFRFRDALSSPTARPWSRRLIRR
ncbi:MAG TPA: hypothetical protein VJ349_26735 [Stellaceae bacterium]|nr:hypothetical protein [Stellaceae bacterium]